MKKKKIPFDILDSIRGIAALYVTIAHCRGTLWMGGNAFIEKFPRDTWSWTDYLVFGSSMLTRLAVEFVIVFFLLSGFSIAHSLAGTSNIKGFFKRRFIRIYPPYLAALFWAGIVFLLTKALFPQWYDGSYSEFSFIRTVQMNDYLEGEQIIRNLFYLPGDGFITPFWSLTFEVIFYLLAPVLLMRVNLYLVISAALFVFHWILKAMSVATPVNNILYEFVFVYNMYFAAGVFLYTYWERIQKLFAAFSLRVHQFLLLAALLVMFAVNFVMKRESEYSFVAAGIFAVLLISYFLAYNIRLPRLMKVGNYSYTLYITHMASIFLYLAGYWLISGTSPLYITNYLVWMGAVPFCMIIAYLQYLLVEKRSKELLKKFRL